MRPVVGPYRGSRFLLHVAKKFDGLPRATVLNGQPATIFVAGGSVVAALVLDIVDGRIVDVRAVTNPDKLARLSARLPEAAAGPGVSLPREAYSKDSSSRRRTLPAAVRGRSSTRTSSFGAAQGAMPSATI